MSVQKIDPLTLNVNLFQSDPLLRDISSKMPRTLQAQFTLLGQFAGSPEGDELARLANHITPQLRTHDAFGERLNLVEYHPAWHALQRKAVAFGLHASVWDDNARKNPGFGHQMRTMGLFLMAGLEAGHLTAATSTHSALSIVLSDQNLQPLWGNKLMSRNYDSSHNPAVHKAGVLLSFAFAERSANGSFDHITTRALHTQGIEYRLTGEKWNVSAPMSDCFLTLAQTQNGISCFLVPRILPDGSQNAIELLRLNNQLGYHSNPQAEIKFDQAMAYRLGEDGQGMRTILDAITLVRHDTGTISAGLMRSSLARAIGYHAQQKAGKDPIAQRVFADMALDCAGASALMMRVARAYDMAGRSPEHAAYARLMTPIMKYWITKIAPGLITETMEQVGFAAFSLQSCLSRNQRDAVTNLAYETGSELLVRDVLRVLVHGRELFDVVIDDVTSDLGKTGERTQTVLQALMSLCESDPGMARMLAEQLALAGAATELKRAGAGGIADAFAETRLGGSWRSSYGMLDSRFDAARIVELLYPKSV